MRGHTVISIDDDDIVFASPSGFTSIYVGEGLHINGSLEAFKKFRDAIDEVIKVHSRVAVVNAGHD